MENFMRLVFWGVPLLFGIFFIINVAGLIIKGDEKYELRAITDISLGILSVPPCLYYYGIWTLHGSQCTSDTPAGELILIIITRIYFMVIEKKLRNTPES